MGTQVLSLSCNELWGACGICGWTYQNSAQSVGAMQQLLSADNGKKPKMNALYNCEETDLFGNLLSLSSYLSAFARLPTSFMF